LEQVKHLFDASGVVFILGIDRSQLNHSIRSLYGSEFDATGYLRRFIDLDYRLPEPEVGDYCAYLFEVFDINELIKYRIRPVGADSVRPVGKQKQSTQEILLFLSAFKQYLNRIFINQSHST
jgi:hypothetical protein